MQVSVVTAVKNDSVGLRTTLTSILGSVQAHDNRAVEIVVVDAGGSEEVARVIQAFDKHIDRVVPDCDEGVAHAFNCGLAECTGDRVAILNAGDCWFRGTLKLVGDIGLTSDAAILHSALTFETRSGRRYEVVPDIAGLSRRMTVFHPTLFVPRQVYATIGAYNERYKLAMDSEWCHRAVAAGVPFVQVADSLALMQLGGRSDVNFEGALAEFRRSVVEHGLASPSAAAYHYWRVRVGKTLTHLPLLRGLVDRIR